VAVVLAGQANNRRVDDGAHLGDVLLQQAIEQDLVTILQGGEIDVALEIRGLGAKALVGAYQLLLDGHDAGRQQTVQMKDPALLFRERAAFIQTRMVE
jgi:hypothetical protein